MSHIEVFQPISAESLYQIEEVTADQVQQVFKRAREAKKRMRQTTAEQRAGQHAAGARRCPPGEITTIEVFFHGDMISLL